MFLSCSRSQPVENTHVNVTWSGARPAAVLQTGEHPIWFKLSESGPVHIETIQDAVLLKAFTPWPYALHIRFLHERADSLAMALNRDGFLKITLGEIPELNAVQPSLFMYYFPGGDFFRRYTIGGFVFYGEKPAAVLYLDRRFIDTDDPPANPRAWSFNMNSNTPFPVQIPALQLFPEDDGWDVDTLRLGNDGLFYFRTARRIGERLISQTFRKTDFDHTGDEISVDTFFSAIQWRNDVSHPSLPPLPEGFVYTEIGQIGGVLFASWEEQADYSIGAAGFLLINNPKY
ncbi:MAG: hypothetical protein FWC97_08300 [Treponema sp.]|nr:hypothetical protein [Treponema sp.]